MKTSNLKITPSVRTLIGRLKKHYPDAHCALHYKTPEELLIATILSAQCTDERVNKVTAPLFQKYPNPKALALAPLASLEKAVHSTGFYKNKAKNIKSCCQSLVKKHKAQVPKTMEELTALAGVGRKTANVVLGNAFNIPSGVVVDTHVGRISLRLGLTTTREPILAERQLSQIIPKKHWVMWSHWLIHHGRSICKSQRPQCAKCPLLDICPRKGLGPI